MGCCLSVHLGGAYALTFRTKVVNLPGKYQVYYWFNAYRVVYWAEIYKDGVRVRWSPKGSIEDVVWWVDGFIKHKLGEQEYVRFFV